jgi:hypothetical protein
VSKAARDHWNEIEVIVRSKRVAREVEEVPYFGGVHHYLGPTAVLRSRRVVYKDELDDEQERLVQSARELANMTGTRLRIHDLSGDGILTKLWRAISGGKALAPKIVIGRPLQSAGGDLNMLLEALVK